MKVTILKVTDPVHGPFVFKPGIGKRYVAVQVRLENIGSKVYLVSPLIGTALIDQNRQRFPADVFDAAEPGIASPNIAPGDALTGYITFELPKGSKPARFQFTLDSGLAPETGEWLLT